jgi:glycosyltransferase involved in cell wall biosynthesis/quercetin dioxygenase-like cupin family protein
MKIAMLSPIAWRTPPRHYGPWENIVSLLTEGLVKKGIDVTLYATGDSVTQAKLASVTPAGYEEDKNIIPKVWECLHISKLFEEAEQYDLIHNHFDFLPLSYSSMITTPVLTTIHGFSSPGILPVYEKYNDRQYYVSISDSNRASSLNYIQTVHHGIDLNQFEFSEKSDDYLLFFGRIHNDKGVKEAIEIARKTHKKLIIAGIIQDQQYFDHFVSPYIDGEHVEFVGSADPVKRNALLGKALALLHPIQFDEPFGLSVIEAMACGTPVIAFNRGSMPEIICHGVNGYLCDDITGACKAIEQLHNIERHACRKTVEKHFTVERMVDDYISVYERIISANALESRRPWGYYRVLADGKDYKSKEITVLPGKRLSLQSHKLRDEHWLVIEGQAEITLNNDTVHLKKGQAIDIPRHAKHRAYNPSKTDLLRFIEVQTGDYFGEDDIIRYSDD